MTSLYINFPNLAQAKNHMSKTSNTGADFINKANTLVLENISNEQFGVSELAELMNMSRSNLLRKIKKHTQLSASQFIRQVRLQKGMEMVKENTLTVSEISYQVGFGSTSYLLNAFGNIMGIHQVRYLTLIKVKESPLNSNGSWLPLCSPIFKDIQHSCKRMRKRRLLTENYTERFLIPQPRNLADVFFSIMVMVL
jgi:AraC-like DNA-binding protein